MYYLALFLNYTPLLKQKLNYLLNDNGLTAVVHHEQGKRILADGLNFPLFMHYSYPQPWLIHGSSSLTSSIDPLTKLPLLQGTSFSKIDSLLTWFADYYSWSIIPWGGGSKGFNSFAFISNDASLRDCLIDAYANTMKITSMLNLMEANLAISRYDVNAKFSDLMQVILFKEHFNYSGSRIWEACQCDKAIPWIVTDIVEQESEEPKPYSWLNANYKIIKYFKLIAADGTFSHLLGVYQAKDKESFLSMLQIRHYQPDTLIVVSQDTNLDKLEKLLGKTEVNRLYSVYSDLSFLPDFLDLGEWFYGLNRDFSDYAYSLFISHNSSLLQRIERIKQNDYYHLISCF